MCTLPCARAFRTLHEYTIFISGKKEKENAKKALAFNGNGTPAYEYVNGCWFDFQPWSLNWIFIVFFLSLFFALAWIASYYFEWHFERTENKLHFKKWKILQTINLTTQIHMQSDQKYGFSYIPILRYEKRQRIVKSIEKNTFCMINSNMLPQVFFHYFEVLGIIAILTTPTAFIANVIVVAMYYYNIFCLNFNLFYHSETLLTVQPMVFFCFLLISTSNFQGLLV